MELIETKTLGADAASIEFTSIPQTYTDLLVLISARSSEANATPLFFLRVNGADNTNRTSIRLSVSAGTVSSTTPTDVRVGNIPGSTATANTFGNTSIYIANYASTVAKGFSSDSVSENNSATAVANFFALGENITTGITSLTFTLASTNNYVTGSTISLYGILKGSDGITTAT